MNIRAAESQAPVNDQAMPNPGHIMQTATAFWASKVLLTAVEFDLFTTLGDKALTADEIGEQLGIAARGRYDFLDALVAGGFLYRNGDGVEGRYQNTPDTGAFLNKNSPAYIGGMPEMLNARLFGFWNDLGEALRTGKAQNELVPANHKTKSSTAASTCSRDCMPIPQNSASSSRQ